MITPVEIAQSQKQAFEAIVGLSQSALEMAEKVAQLHLNLVKDGHTDAVEQGKKLMAVKDMQELVQAQTNAVQPHVERLMSYSKSLYDISSTAQSAMSKAIEAQLSEMNRGIVEALDRAAKNGPQGSDAAVAAAKSIMAAANSAYDSMNKAAKKVTEMTEANLNTATQVASKAVNATAKKK